MRHEMARKSLIVRLRNLRNNPESEPELAALLDKVCRKYPQPGGLVAAPMDTGGQALQSKNNEPTGESPTIATDTGTASANEKGRSKSGEANVSLKENGRDQTVIARGYRDDFPRGIYTSEIKANLAQYHAERKSRAKRLYRRRQADQTQAMAKLREGTDMQGTGTVNIGARDGREPFLVKDDVLTD